MTNGLKKKIQLAQLFLLLIFVLLRRKRNVMVCYVGYRHNGLGRIKFSVLDTKEGYSPCA